MADAASVLVSDVAPGSPVVRLALVEAPVAVVEVEPAPAWSCIRNDCRSLVNCWKSAALPVGDVLLLDPLCVVPEGLGVSAATVFVALLVEAVLLANKLDWETLEIDT